MYFKRANEDDWEGSIPDAIPHDLCSKEDQALIWENSRTVLWIRTWYGRKESPGTATVSSDADNAARQASADAEYDRIWRRAVVDEDTFVRAPILHNSVTKARPDQLSPSHLSGKSIWIRP